MLGLWSGGSTAAHEAGEGVWTGGAEDSGGGVRAVGAKVAGAAGVVIPMVLGLRPEVDFGIVIIDAACEDGAIWDEF